MRASARVIGRKILRYEQVQSTNDLAGELAERGEPEGVVVTAEEQVAGRGRMGRQWLVPRGTSLQFSVLLRPSLAPRHAFRLTQMAGLAVARTLEREFDLEPTLKWSNDVLLNDLKVSGILTETRLRGEALDFCILGIGLNGNYSMQMYPQFAPFATTLQDVLGQSVDRAALQDALLAELDRYYERVRRGETLSDEYRARLAMLGQPIRVATPNGIVEGIAQDVAEDGALVLAHAGLLEKLYAGDVSIVKRNSAREAP